MYYVILYKSMWRRNKGIRFYWHYYYQGRSYFVALYTYILEYQFTIPGTEFCIYQIYVITCL